MGDLHTPMSPGDHVVANCIICLATETSFPVEDNHEMVISILADALHKAAAENPHMAKVAEAGWALVAAKDRGIGSTEYVGAIHRARTVLNGWALWRLGQAQAAAAKGKAA